MKAFIRSTASISPQKTFQANGFLMDIVEYHQNRLNAIEPEYKEFIDPKLIRRMSRIIKMGVSAAKGCLYKAGVEMPGAIITGTALGCQDDTVQFLSRLIEQHEELLSPTAFVQSTHNTVAAQIALMLHCHNYNNTFVHKGISFESALLDAIMLLQEKEATTVLVGGTEEITDTSFKILTRLGLYKRQCVSNLALLKSNTTGTIGGEGATFFLLTSEASSNNLAMINGVKTFFKPADQEVIEKKISGFLAENELTVRDIDLVITGKNGNPRNDATYNGLTEKMFSNVALANYKHLCGEYSTSTSFALWVAANIFNTGFIPDVLKENQTQPGGLKNILIYNHYLNTYHSLMLVSSI